MAHATAQQPVHEVLILVQYDAPLTDPEDTARALRQAMEHGEGVISTDARPVRADDLVRVMVDQEDCPFLSVAE